MKPLHILLLLAGAYVVGLHTAPTDSTEVDELRAQIAPLQARADSQQTVISALVFEADSIQTAYTADSVRWTAERGTLARDAAQARQRIDSTTLALREIGDARVDSLVTELEAAHAEAEAAHAATVQTLEDERDALLTQRDQLQLAVVELRAHIDVQNQVIQRQDDLNAAIIRDQPGFSDTLRHVAVGALVGAVVWELAR